MIAKTSDETVEGRNSKTRTFATRHRHVRPSIQQMDINQNEIMIKTVYLLEWYGPFTTPKEVIKWEKEQIGNGKTYLYLFKGKERSKRSFSYYCGQAYGQTAGERMSNQGHHIKDVIERPKDLSIWVAKFQNKKPAKKDVNIVEKLITSTMSQVYVTDENAILNQTNKLRPKSQIYLINEWYKPDGTPRSNYSRNSIPSLINDVLICYPNNDCDFLWGNRRIQYLNKLN